MGDVIKGLREITLGVIGIPLIGFLFLFSITVSLLLPFLATLDTFHPGLFDAVVKRIRSPDSPVLVTSLIAMSYILGHIFWRRDPNLPDSYSFHMLSEYDRQSSPAYILPSPHAHDEAYQQRYERNLEDEQHLDAQLYSMIYKVFDDCLPSHPLQRYPKLAKFSKWLAKRFPWRTGHFIEWPYPRIKEFLENRGMSHLARIIPWSEHDLRFHDKVFINVLKTRIALENSSKYEGLHNMENTIRFSSALWYCFRPIWGAAFLGFLFGVFSHISAVLLGHDLFEIHRTVASLGAVFTFFAICFVEKSILRSFHLMRVKEIVQTLETAYYMNKLEPTGKILEDIPAGQESSGGKGCWIGLAQCRANLGWQPRCAKRKEAPWYAI
jgi:hypothetical protein